MYDFVLGVGKFSTLYIFAFAGDLVAILTLCPKYLTWFCANLLFKSLTFKFAFSILSKIKLKFFKCSSQVFENTAHCLNTELWIPEIISINQTWICWRNVQHFSNAKLILKHQNEPKVIQKTAYHYAFWLKGICQQPFAKSRRTIIKLSEDTFSALSSMLGRGKYSVLIISFNLW